jgi:hypothetical protein
MVISDRLRVHLILSTLRNLRPPLCAESGLITQLPHGVRLGRRDGREAIHTNHGLLMTTAQSKFTVASHFTKSAAAVSATYAEILKAARALGPVREEPKKTSIHLVRTRAFAGVATRKDALILTLKAERPIKNPRIRRSEQASAHRWHLEIPLREPRDVDAELRTWILQAYALA